jgi:hypothetical protein
MHRAGAACGSDVDTGSVARRHERVNLTWRLSTRLTRHLSGHLSTRLATRPL